MSQGVDRIVPQKPWHAPEPVLQHFACFKFPSGAAYAGSVNTIFRFNPELILTAEITICSQKDALRWAIESPAVPPTPPERSPR